MSTESIIQLIESSHVTLKRPISGQFVAVWKSQGQLWSGTFKYIDGLLHQYMDYEDAWMIEEEVNYNFTYSFACSFNDAIFIVLNEEPKL